MRRVRLKKFFLKWLVIILGLVFIIPAVWSIIHNSAKIYLLNKKKKSLELENRMLKSQILEASYDEYVERVARVKLGLKKPNEIEYRFISDNTSLDK